MDKIVQVSINSEAIEKIIEQQLQHLLQQTDGKQVFWDMKTLCKKRVCPVASYKIPSFGYLTSLNSKLEENGLSALKMQKNT